MRTRNSYFPNNSSVTILRRRNKRRTPNVVEPELRTIVQVAPMADNRTMDELLQAPMEGYGEDIVILEINADHFEIKTNLLQLVQANPYHDFERKNPHTHINNFKRITSTLKFRDVPNDAWERFKEMLRACPHHRFTKLAQIDTFYNSLNDNDQDFLNAAAGGNLLSKTTREALQIIENKSKVRYSRNKSNVSRMNKTSRENASKSAHAYYNFPNTDSNQPSVFAATGTYNQVAPQNRASNFMAPPGFAPVQNSQNRWKDNNTPGKKVSKNVSRYFLIIPRLQRLYKSSHTVKKMTWHATRKCTQPGKMQHPVDGRAWKDFDTKYLNFVVEPRNVRLGLATDGFNPFGNLSKDIGVYLRPLIDNLKDLWANPSVETIDVATGLKFNMRAMVLWTINGFPDRISLSG
uniref:Reverse transcriptase domain-containing protein n=1 Tax=Tanacetum cinerariifolium TaxID=118510 RepID=A0A699H275_TANCI|nr:hypothetical protein [Tanacetum cinerariifolium]